MHKTYCGKEKLRETFQRIGEQLAKPLTVFMFGGGAMAFRGQKQGTKDLDLVFETRSDFEMFADAVEKIGFRKVKFLEKYYEEMSASGIWENEKQFRLDIFIKTVCNALELNSGIEKRSELLEKFEKLTVKMFSNEDLILFKGITDRPADAEDISTIIKSVKIDWTVILQECVLQSKKRPWHGALLTKLAEIEQSGKFVIPITNQLQELADHALLIQFYKDKLEEGNPREEIVKRLKREGATEKEIERVEKELQLNGVL